jgi:serine/threonine protein kinase
MTSLLATPPSDYPEIFRGKRPSGLEGQVIDGRFKVTGVLHDDTEGLKSVIFQADDLEAEGTEAAIKVVRVADAAITATFAAEIAVANDLSHSTDGSIEVLGEGISHTNGQTFPYYAMKYEQGGTLADEVKKLRHEEERQFGVTELLGALRPAVETLSYMHGRGIVHGDIKPSNFLWDEEMGIFLLADFGNVNLDECDSDYLESEGISEEVVELIQPEPGKLTGSTRYFAPELRTLQTGHTKESDMYAFGVTMFQGLLDRLPGISIASLREIRKGDYSIEVPQEIRKDIPKALGKFMMACVAADPEFRATSRDAGEVFDEVLEEDSGRDQAEGSMLIAA